MNGVHDMGGMRCHGPILIEEDEPVFHSEWERRVLGLVLAAGASGKWNLDSSRAMRESLPPAQYLSIGYYRIWLQGLEKLLLESGMVTADELASGEPQVEAVAVKHVLKADEVATVMAKGAPVDRPAATPAAFSVGDKVRVRNYQPATHTRLPAYVRGHVGQVVRLHGCHIFPDTHALHAGEDPRWLYCVRFEAEELWDETVVEKDWPNGGAGAVHVDCWEPYLESA